MRTWAVIRDEDQICDNVVLWDGVTEWAPPDYHGLIELMPGDHAGIGWKWDGVANEWIDVRPPVEPQFTVGI